MLNIIIDTVTVCSCHVMYVFQSEFTLYSCLNVKELLAQNRREIWRLSDWVLLYELSGCGFEFSCSQLKKSFVQNTGMFCYNYDDDEDNDDYYYSFRSIINQISETWKPFSVTRERNWNAKVGMQTTMPWFVAYIMSFWECIFWHQVLNSMSTWS